MPSSLRRGGGKGRKQRHGREEPMAEAMHLIKLTAFVLLEHFHAPSLAKVLKPGVIDTLVSRNHHIRNSTVTSLGRTAHCLGTALFSFFFLTQITTFCSQNTPKRRRTCTPTWRWESGGLKCKAKVPLTPAFISYLNCLGFCLFV